MTVDTAARSPELLPGQRFIPDLEEILGRYRVRFARTSGELEAIQRLRFRVFNLELGEGLAESFASGRDEDLFDAQCQHLMVEDTASGETVGTYRLQLLESAQAGAGFYSAGEFDLGAIPDEMLDSVELGRACVEREHRSKRVLFLLWRGLTEYGLHNGKTGYFGCSSLTSQDCAEGLRLYAQLQSQGRVHLTVRAEPLPEFACETPAEGIAGPPVSIPPLFQIYLRHGASIISPPAIDREFGTIDYLTFIERNAGHERKFGRRAR